MKLRFVELGAAAAVFACVAGACSSSSKPPPSPGGEGIPDAGSSGESSPGIEGSTQVPDGGDATGGDGQGGDGSPGDGSAGDAPDASGSESDGTAGDAVAEVGPAPTPLCPAGATWGTGTQLAISTAADDLMGAITPDELTIGWITNDGTNVGVLYADRSSAQGAFGAATMAPAAAGFYAPTKVALSPDGLRTMVVATNNKSFGVITRATRSGPFTSTGTAEVNDIDTNVAEGEASFFLDDPVIGATDETFYYSLYGSQLVDTVIESTRTGQSAWPNGTSLAGTAGEFNASVSDASGPVLRHPTGVSADNLTLFYWDDVDATEKMASRPRTTQPFGPPVTLGALRGAAPNAACDALYYSAPGTAGGLDLFVAARQ